MLPMLIYSTQIIENLADSKPKGISLGLKKIHILLKKMHFNLRVNYNMVCLDLELCDVHL